MEIEDWRYDLQGQLEELRVGERESPIAVSIGHPPTEDDIREADEIITEAGRAVLELKPDMDWLIAEVA